MPLAAPPVVQQSPKLWYPGFNFNHPLAKGMTQAYPLVDGSLSKIWNRISGQTSSPVTINSSPQQLSVKPSALGLALHNAGPSTTSVGQGYDMELPKNLGDFTINFWINCEVPGPTKYTVFRLSNGSTEYINCSYINDGTGVFPDGTVVNGLWVTFNDGVSAPVVGADQLVFNRWYMVTIQRQNKTFTASLGAGNYLVKLANSTAPILTPDKCTFGYGNGTTNYFWKGFFANYGVWKRSLSLPEISSLTMDQWQLYRYSPELTSFDPNQYVSSGGVVVGGSANTTSGGGSFYYFPSGGVVVGGTANEFQSGFHYVSDGSPGVIMGGTATVMANYGPIIANTSGDIVMGGTAPYKIGYKYISDGFEVVTGGAGTASHVSKIDINALWSVRANVVTDLDIRWGATINRPLFYRVVGRCKTDSCDPLSVGDGCPRQYVMNVQAHSVSDLCNKLAKRNWVWPIESVHQFSQPARTVDIQADEAAGIGMNCNALIPVSICTNSLCQEFCLDFDLVDHWGGVATAQVNAFNTYIGSGTIFITGSAEASTTGTTSPGAFSWISRGDGIVMGGEASVSSTVMGIQVVESGAYAEAMNVSIIFGNETVENNLAADSSTVTECNCSDLPLTLPFSHNLFNGNKLAQFFIRNSLSVPSITNLRYNKINNVWQNNQRFVGFSVDGTTQDLWNLVFELQCDDLVGGQSIGQSIWKLSMSIKKKNLTTAEDYDTRFLIGFLPNIVCESGKQFKFQVNFNTQLETATIDPASTIYYTILYDNIGLFKEPYWIKNPNFSLSVSETGLTQPAARLPFVLQ